MPVIRLENVGKLKKEQKQELIEKITEIVVKVTKKPKEYVYIRIDELDGENFGIGGEQLG